MDPIYRMILEAWSATLVEPTKGIVSAIVERLDEQLVDAHETQRAEAIRIYAALSAPAPPSIDPGLHALVARDAWEAILGAVGDGVDAGDQGAVSQAVVAAFALNDVQAESLQDVRVALGDVRGDLTEEAKRTMQAWGAVLKERDALRLDLDAAIAARDEFDVRLTAVRWSLPDGVASEDLAEDVRGLAAAYGEAVDERDAARRQAEEYRLHVLGRDETLKSIREALGISVDEEPSRPVLFEVRRLVEDRDEWRAMAQGQADENPPVQTSAPEVEPPVAAGPDDVGIPLADEPSPPAIALGEEYTTNAMVDRKIKAEETTRAVAVAEMIAAVGPVPESVVSRYEVSVGSLSEMLNRTVDGEPGSSSARAGTLLKEHHRSHGSMDLGAWIHAHSLNLTSLTKAEDKREYRAQFSARVVADKKAKGAKVAA